MKNKFKLIIAMLLAGAMAFSLAACNKADSGSYDGLIKITFALDWTPNTNHTGIYAADSLGYFEEAGIEVTIVQPAEDSAELMVATNSAQFGVSFQDTMMPSLIGEDALPITAVAAIIQHNTSGIISRADEGMDTPAGLEGKSYATWDLDIEKAILKSVVENDGGDFDQVKLIPSTVTDEASALQTKSVDAIWVYYGWAGIACELAGLETDYFAFTDIDETFDYYSPVIIGNTDWMKENPQAAAAFLEAVSKGYEYAAENPEEAADILCEACPELDSELVHKSQEYLSPRYIDDASRWGVINADRWNAFYNWINDEGLAEEIIPENTGFTNEYLPAED